MIYGRHRVTNAENAVVGEGGATIWPNFSSNLWVRISYSIYRTYSILNQHLAAAEQNNQLNFAGLRIYGLLTNFTQFNFYSHCPTTKQFSYDENISINNGRLAAFYDMIDGPHLFTTIGADESLQFLIKFSV